MPILNKQQLLQENNTNFPNNNDQLITPALLRQFNTDMIDSMQLTQSLGGYAVLSGSNTFLGNQNITGDVNIVGTLTATTIHTITESSSIIYSSGSNQLGDALTDTQILSGSVQVVGSLTLNGVAVLTSSAAIDTGSLVTTASFNAYTQSNNQRVSSLEANTASVNTSISALNSFTQSQQGLNATFATTGSNTFKGNQIIDKANVLYTNGIYWNDTTPGYTNLEIINQTGGNLDFASLNGGRLRVVNTSMILTGSALTSSNDISTSANIYAANLTGSTINTGSFVTTASFNAYTQSNDTIVSSLVVTTNAQQILINNLNAASASLFTSASNALVTASLSGQTLTFRKGDNSTFGIQIPDVSGSDISALNAFTASQLQINSGYNTFTQSIQAEVDNLQAATSSYALSASVAAVDAAQQSQINSLINATSSYADSASFAASQLAQDVRIDGLSAQTSSYVTDSETGSFARYDVSNPWSAEQTFTNISAVSASFQYVQTIFETASVIYSSGSNQFGDELTDTQTLSGSVKVQGSLTVNGVPVQTSSVDISSLNQATASLQAFTQSANIRLDNLESNSASVNTSIANINTFTQSADQRLDSIEAQSGSWVTSAITASSIITASVVDDDITFTKGDGTQFTIQVSTGSFAVSASYAETASIARNLVVVARNGNQSTLPIGTVVHITSAVGDNPIFNTASFDTELLSANTLGVLRQAAISGTDVEVVVQGTVTGVNTDPTLGYAAGDVIYLSSSGQFTRVQPQAPNQIVVLGQVLRAQQNNGSIYVSINNGWELNELHNVQINNPQTGDLIQYESSSYGLWKNKSIAEAGINTTSSFNAYTSSTNSRLNSIEIFTQSIQAEVDDIQLKTGSFATTGSNTFTNHQNFLDSGSYNTSLYPFSGSFIITPGNVDNNFQISSATTFPAPFLRLGGNLYLKTATNQSGSLVISGSGNILTSLPSIQTGFRTQYNASNIVTTHNAISASMTFPMVVSNNVQQAALTLRGPVSSSTYIINTNYFGSAITLGTSAANNFEKAIAGSTISNNLINGTITAVANTANFNTSFNIQNSNINQTLAINAISSSVQITNSNMGGLSATINNRASHSVSPGTNNYLAISSVLTSGQTTTINADGASATNVPPGIVASLIGGSQTNIQLGSLGVTSDSNQLRNSIVFGNNLTVTGSNSSAATATNGSTFVGRWNADGIRNNSSYAVFAVGTGTATASRKTGFLIDSGSNTYVEGSLNVSGSSAFNGNAQFTGSLIASGSATVTGSVSISNVLSLAQLDPLPVGATGQLAVSASLLWFYDATQWKQVSLV